MQLVVFDAESWERDLCEEWRADHEVKVSAHPLKRASASYYTEAEIASVFIYSQIDEAVLKLMPRLRLVATRSTGTDHIDIEACHRRGVVVCHVPSYGKHTVAEHVFALLLALSHRVVEAADRTRRGDFSTRDLKGFDLFGKTLGVLGAGDIGTQTLRIARGFGMHTLAYDIAPDEEKAKEAAFTYVDLPTLLRESDVLSIHVPASPRTLHMLGEPEMRHMKRGAVLINTARGDVVDTRALARALADGQLRGAGLDVLPHEPTIREEAELLRAVYERQHDLDTLLANEVLCRMRNVVVTPHTAFYTEESVARILDITRENIRAFLREAPSHVVPPLAGHGAVREGPSAAAPPN